MEKRMTFEEYISSLGYSDRYAYELLVTKRYLEKRYGKIPDRETIRRDMWDEPKTTRKRFYKFINLYEHYKEVMKYAGGRNSVQNIK